MRTPLCVRPIPTLLACAVSSPVTPRCRSVVGATREPDGLALRAIEHTPGRGQRIDDSQSKTSGEAVAHADHSHAGVLVHHVDAHRLVAELSDQQGAGTSVKDHVGDELADHEGGIVDESIQAVDRADIAHAGSCACRGAHPPVQPKALAQTRLPLSADGDWVGIHECGCYAVYFPRSCPLKPDDCGESLSSQAVDALTKDVGVAVVTGVLLDHLQQVPAHRSP